MEAPSPALRSNRAVVTAVVVAAAAVTIFSGVGIASLLGWLPERQKAAFIPPEQRKGPDEPAPRAPPNTLAPIEVGKRSEPLMPHYSMPDPPPPAPAESVAAERPAPRPPVQAAATPAPAPPPPVAREAPPPPVAREAQPVPAPAPRPPAYVAAARPGRCDDCGRVTGVSNRDDLWEVHVRFEDGGLQTFRYRSRPPFETGDRVRLDGRFLNPD